MNAQQATDLQTPIGEVLKVVGANGLVLEAADAARYALLPLNDDLLDYLLERSPKLIEECRQIHQRMAAGEYYTQEEVEQLLDEE